VEGWSLEGWKREVEQDMRGHFLPVVEEAEEEDKNEVEREVKEEEG
jgi:hypothetical protein